MEKTPERLPTQHEVASSLLKLLTADIDQASETFDLLHSKEIEYFEAKITQHYRDQKHPYERTKDQIRLYLNRQLKNIEDSLVARDWLSTEHKAADLLKQLRTPEGFGVIYPERGDKDKNNVKIYWADVLERIVSLSQDAQAQSEMDV